MFRTAYSWYMKNPSVIITKKYEEFIQYLAAGHDNKDKELKKEKYETFDEYKENRDHVYMIKFCNVKKRWLTESTCSCRYFQNNFICKHIIGFASFKKLKKCPEEGNDTMISALPKKGRIPRAKSALVRQ